MFSLSSNKFNTQIYLKIPISVILGRGICFKDVATLFEFLNKNQFTVLQS